MKDNRILELDEENFQFRDYINSLEQEAQRIKERLDQREKDLEDMYLEKEELKLKYQQLLDDFEKIKNMRPAQVHVDEDADLFSADFSGDESAVDAMKIFVRVNEKIGKYNRLMNRISTVFTKYLRSSSCTSNSNQTMLPTRPSSLRSSLSNSFSNIPNNSGHMAPTTTANQPQTSSGLNSNTVSSNVNTNKKRRTNNRRSSQMFSNMNDMNGAGLIQPQASCDMSTRFSIEGDYVMATLSPNSIRSLNNLKAMQQKFDMRPVPAVNTNNIERRNSLIAEFDDVSEETEEEQIEDSSSHPADHNIHEMTTEDATANQTEVGLFWNYYKLTIYDLSF
jgi:hypothetical protein